MTIVTGEPTGTEYRQPRVSLHLLRAARPRDGGQRISIGELIRNLGEESFGWCLIVVGLINMMPLPVGSNLVTALPAIILTWQMCRGWHYVHIPAFIARRDIDSTAFRRRVASIRWLTARLERVLRPRYQWIFAPAYYRAIAVMLFAISLALFLPILGTGFILASSIFTFAIGLIAEDGLVALAGLGLGLIAAVFAATLLTVFTLGISGLF
jgi:hypothetical protein